jgi:putative tryptophan/tyrosine transport system substrate-binding protein
VRRDPDVAQLATLPFFNGWRTLARPVHEHAVGLRWLAGLWIACLMASAQAGPNPPSATLDHGDAIQRDVAAGAQTGVPAKPQPVPRELPAVRLAQVSEQPRRTDAQLRAMAVIYPDIGEPYRSIFAKMIEGIEDNAKAVVHSYPIVPGTESGDLNAQLKRSGIKVVIALGRQGLKIASTLDRDMPVVVGGVLTAPDNDNRNMTSISLTPDPALLFARLKSMLSGVKRVIVVYDPRYNDWLIKLAREAARAQGLELVAYEARDLATAARLYESAFAASDGRRDAIWLPQDATTVDEATILPLVLKESWNRGVPVFSSSFLHVKKGALFALYPNNMGLGHTLAATAQAVMSGDFHKHGMLPLRDVYTAVNLRTASHIGLSIGYQQQREFDFIFPEP